MARWALTSGWVDEIIQMPSPNYNARPKGVLDVSLIVMHCISLPKGIYDVVGDCNNVQDLFLNRLDCTKDSSFQSLEEMRVSAHFFIRRGGVCIQFVSTNDRAWHAGESEFNGRDNCNDFSIGIEFEGTDNTSFEDKQYQTASNLIVLLRQHYPINNIVGHEDIAPGRKTDPGKYFDYSKLVY